MNEFHSPERYSRQMRFGGIGKAGQERISAGRVTVCGCGALGTVLANHLVRAGVGHVRVVDRDFIETHNLQRLAGKELVRAREDIETLVGYAKEQKWPKQHVLFLKGFLEENGVAEE